MQHTNAVLQGLVDMKVYDGHGNGLQYSVNGVDYTTDQIIEEIKNDTEVGKKFSQMVYDIIISYMGKFSQNPVDANGESEEQTAPYLTELVNKSAENFDPATQDLILIEEMTELTKELLKRRRGKSNAECIKEELSHVLISLRVVMLILGITDEDLENEAKKKLEKYGWLNVNEAN